MLPNDHLQRIKVAETSLIGFSVGDAFGEAFFSPDAEDWIQNRTKPAGLRHFTDDSVMGISVYSILNKYGTIDQQELATIFA